MNENSAMISTKFDFSHFCLSFLAPRLMIGTCSKISMALDLNSLWSNLASVFY